MFYGCNRTMPLKSSFLLVACELLDREPNERCVVNTWSRGTVVVLALALVGRTRTATLLHTDGALLAGCLGLKRRWR